jgi:hypothetical protein
LAGLGFGVPLSGVPILWEVTAFNLLLEWLSISIGGVRPTDLPSTSMMMDASGAGGGDNPFLFLGSLWLVSKYRRTWLGKKEIRSLLRESGSGFLVRSK